jgi:hypothetical protein
MAKKQGWPKTGMARKNMAKKKDGQKTDGQKTMAIFPILYYIIIKRIGFSLII